MEFWPPICDLSLVLAGIGYAELPWYGNALIALWLWCFGANVGSFMNVVVFRLPAGKSVVAPRSRCPSCRSAIRWFDNVPVLSWLWLRTRCRRCGVSISSRYPSVEAAVAALFVVMAFLGPMTSGSNLPQTLVAPPLRLHTLPTLWLMYTYQLMMVCTLICAALINYDRQHPPLRLFVPALLAGFAAPLFWPELRPLAFAAPITLGDHWIALLDGWAGAAVAVALGMIHVACWLGRDEGVGRPGRLASVRPLWPEPMAAGLAGLVLGWQAAAVVIVVAEVGHLATRLLSRHQPWWRRIPWTGHLVVAAIGYIGLWRAITDSSVWLGGQATMGTFAVALGAVAILAGLSAAVAPRATNKSSFLSPSQIPAPHLMPPQLPPHDPSLADEQPGSVAILNSPSYRLAECDIDFLQRPELRPIRLQLESLKPELLLSAEGVESTVVAFGGTQIVERGPAEQSLERARSLLEQDPEDPRRQREVARAERILAKCNFYDEAREFGRLVSVNCQHHGDCGFVIMTGGGPGVMEAANRGASDAGAKSIGLNITLAEEQVPNEYITPELCFQFHYFAIRKMHFLLRAKALVVFPGGFGTLDELFDALTLRQTNRMQPIPIILYGRDYWDRVIDFRFLADEGVIRDEHLDLIEYAETPAEAWDIIARFHAVG